MKTVFKKNQVTSYDASTYVKMFGQQNFKLYISYRSYMLEMLTELSNDFELILFSTSNSQKFVTKVLEALNKGNEKYPFFDHTVSNEDTFHFKDIDFNILDLKAFIGPIIPAVTGTKNQQNTQGI